MCCALIRDGSHTTSSNSNKTIFKSSNEIRRWEAGGVTHSCLKKKYSKLSQNETSKD